MNNIVMQRADARVLLFHLALYGLGSILEDAGVPDVRVSWTPGAQPRPTVRGDGLTSDIVDDAVRQHAHSRLTEPSWLLRDVQLSGTLRGLMSPRLTTFGDPQVWLQVQDARHAELDRLTDRHRWSDLRYLAALGEPCYWSHNRQGHPLQDDGASRLEMQPRNQGSELVGTRLRRLAEVVSARASGSVVTGIEGTSVVDEAGADKVDSRTPTGLASPGPTDNAVAWCALWGIGQLPLAPRIDATALTSGHIGHSRSEWFYAPVWEVPWRPSRVRSVLTARQLHDAAAVDLPARWAVEPTRGVGARRWLAARSILGVVRFPIQRFGSDSAPERRAMRGLPLSTAL